ncbi:MAG: desulfoferrodoxin [Theionarchaea archaeon]|nr:desulfoferrodoxin [Theionarchaea archaeon]MBU7001335.1 desulfoferrodoxin [Theionarchaea archaeon]MBU7019826.1 desulfoferrodoxin [Theionarchaea archaeon]MBU7035135.1 desulfoferrodoxin [Theionarchaea archaeon]MBU7040750.1 desulfoferrodoxin [Theionarchaea archaeon]
MTKKLQVYKCTVCGNIVEVLHEGVGQLVCCGQPMELMVPKTADVGKEKHVPVVEKKDNTVTVKVGSIPHPMEATHYIEWVEVIADGRAYRKFLNPGDSPEAKFEIAFKTLEVREYCNVHGLWMAT